MAKKGVLEGQAALVTGASSGIGAGICLAFAREGAKVGINFHSDKDEADALVAKIERAGGEAIALKADISDEAQVAELYKRFVKRFGRVDIAVANAGIQKDAPLTNMTMAQWNQVIGTNLGGVFLCAREAVRRFIEQGESPVSKARGKIICMSSVHDRIPWAGHVNYAASKGGIAMLMQSIAQEVAVHRIRVNAISPGAIKTPINKDAWSTPKARKKLLQLIPYGRIGEPDDVAQAAVWLCSDAADYVTGTTLYVDGGMCLYPGFADNG